MSLYLDSSAVVSLLVTEPASAAVEAFLRAREADGLAISRWVEAEVASALSLKIRTGELTIGQRADIMVEWQHWRDSLLVIAVEAPDFDKAALYVARHDLGLRAGDALHLAVASAHGCTLVTLDERMTKAAPEFGVPVAAL